MRGYGYESLLTDRSRALDPAVDPAEPSISWNNHIDTAAVLFLASGAFSLI